MIVMSKRLILFIVLNMLVVIGCIVAGFYFYGQANKYFARNVTYVAPHLNENHLHFNLAQVRVLERVLPDSSVVAISRGSITLSASTQRVTTRVVYSNTAYFSVHSTEFVEGGHWHGLESSFSIVLNQALAWRLFGATEGIVGLPVWVEAQVYTVTGIVHQAEAGGYLAWMPAESGDMPVTSLYIRSHVYYPLMAYVVQDTIRQVLNRPPNDYAVVDINRFVESMNVRNQLLISVIWMVVLIYFVRKVWQRLERDGAKAFRDFRGIWLPIGGILVCGYGLWGINAILMWLPNLGNPVTSLFASISTVGMLPPDGYLSYGMLRLGQLSWYVNIAFIVGLVGIFNLIFCLHFRSSDDECEQ